MLGCRELAGGQNIKAAEYFISTATRKVQRMITIFAGSMNSQAQMYCNDALLITIREFINSKMSLVLSL